MTARTKHILKEAIEMVFNNIQWSYKDAVKMVKQNIAKHENGLKNIGVGFDDDMVQAGYIFLRIYDKKK